MSCNMRKSVWKCPTRTNINLIVPLPEWVLRKKGILTIYEVTFAIKLYGNCPADLHLCFCIHVYANKGRGFVVIFSFYS